MKEYIVSACPAGLGNRLKGMMSAIKMVEEGLYKDWKVSWPTQWNCISKFQDLFDLPGRSIDLKHDGPNVYGLPNNMDKLVTDKLWLSDNDDITKDFALPKHDPWRGDNIHKHKEGRNIDFEYHRIPPGTVDNYAEIFKQIKFNSEWVEEANEFAEKHFNHNTVAVQVRTWIECPKRKPLCCKDAYYKMLDDSNNNFFISADSFLTIHEFKQRYKNKIIDYNPNNMTDLTRKWGVKEDVINLLLASRCKIIIGAYLSSFTEMAWYASNCRALVLFPETNKGD